jgi:hypothetical protein
MGNPQPSLWIRPEEGSTTRRQSVGSESQVRITVKKLRIFLFLHLFLHAKKIYFFSVLHSSDCNADSLKNGHRKKL